MESTINSPLNSNEADGQDLHPESDSQTSPNQPAAEASPAPDADVESVPSVDASLADLADRIGLPLAEMAGAVDLATYEASTPDQQLRMAYDLIPKENRQQIEGQNPAELRSRFQAAQARIKNYKPILHAAALAFALGGCAPKGQAEKTVTPPEQSSTATAPEKTEAVNEAPIIPETVSLADYERISKEYERYSLNEFVVADDAINRRLEAVELDFQGRTEALESTYEIRIKTAEQDNNLPDKDKILAELQQELTLERRKLNRQKEAAVLSTEKQRDHFFRAQDSEKAAFHEKLYKKLGLMVSLSQEKGLLDDYLTKIKSPLTPQGRTVFHRMNAERDIESMDKSGTAKIIAEWLTKHPGSSVDVLGKDLHYYEPDNRMDRSTGWHTIVLKIQEQGKAPVVVRGESGDLQEAWGGDKNAVTRALENYEKEAGE